MYIRRASSPNTVLWAFHTIQPSSFNFQVAVFVLVFCIDRLNTWSGQVKKVKASHTRYRALGPELIQAVSAQVTVSHPPGCRLPWLSARPTITSPASEHHALWPVPNYTACWQRHIGVNNLPKVVTQRHLEQDLNSRPVDRKPKRLTHCTTASGQVIDGIYTIEFHTVVLKLFLIKHSWSFADSQSSIVVTVTYIMPQQNSSTTSVLGLAVEMSALSFHSLRPNSSTLSGSKLVAYRFEAGHRPAASWNLAYHLAC